MIGQKAELVESYVGLYGIGKIFLKEREFCPERVFRKTRRIFGYDSEGKLGFLEVRNPCFST